jgi:hypothetical protein
MDVSAQITMKDAAKCDKQCEWQNSANQENAERILHFWATPKSMSGSGLLASYVAKNTKFTLVLGKRFCAPLLTTSCPVVHQFYRVFFR